MFFRKAASRRSLDRQAKKTAGRNRSWLGRRRGIAMEPLEERRLLAVYAPDYDGPIDQDHVAPFVPSGGAFGNVITYSFVPGGTALAPGGVVFDPAAGPSIDVATFLPANFRQIIRRAFDEWEGVADIQFVEVADQGEQLAAAVQVSGHIRISGHNFDGPGGVLAHCFFPPPNTGTSFDGDLHFDAAEAWVDGFAGAGFDVFQVTAHEVGHGIGLNHTAVPNSLMNPFYSEALAGVQSDDINGAQSIYGPAPLNFVVDANSANQGFGGAQANDGTGDSFVVQRAVNGDVQVFANGVLVKSAPVAVISSITIHGSSDSDTLLVDTSNGLMNTTVRFLAGDGFDRISLVQAGGAPQFLSEWDIGATPGSGEGFVSGPTGFQIIDFFDVEPIEDSLLATDLVITGFAAINSLLQGDNSINYTNSPLIGGWGRVTVDNFEPIDFANKTNLTINAGAGSDTINLNNRFTPLGLTGSIFVDGGDPTAASDTLVVNGTPGGNAIGYNPSNTIGAGSVTVGGLPAVVFSTMEKVAIDGQGGMDVLTYTTAAGVHTIDYIPGVTADTGTIAARVAGGGTTLVPLTFSHISGNGSVNFASGGGREDVLRLAGTDNSDIFAVNGAADSVAISTPSGGFVTTLLNTGGINVLELRGLSGDDVFNVAGALPYTEVAVDAGNPSASDVVNFTGAGGPITVNLDALTVSEGANVVSLSGVEHLNVNAVGALLTVVGTAGPDDFDVTPTGANTTTVTKAGLNLTINTTNTVPLLLDPSGGADTVTVHGTSGPIGDSIAVGRGATTTVQVNVLQLIGLVAASTESLIIDAGSADDFINVTGSGGIPNLLIDGGVQASAAGDRVTVTTSGTATVTPGATPDAGTIGSNTGNVNFVRIEEVNLTAAVATDDIRVRGTEGDDSIALQNLGGNRVWVNDRAVVTFSGFDGVILDGRFGSDSISVTSVGLTGVAAIDVIGGDPTGSDTVVVNGTAGQDTVAYTPVGADSGTITGLGAPINISTAEHLIYNGLGGSDLVTINGTGGDDTIVHTPGAGVDEGVLRVNSTLALDYRNLGATGALTAHGGSDGADQLVAVGTASADLFVVQPITGTVTQTNASGQRIALQQVAIEGLTLDGLGGDDTFQINGGQPYTSIQALGGEPGGSDVLNVIGLALTNESFVVSPGFASGAGVVAVNLLGIAYVGVEHVLLDANAGDADDLIINDDAADNVWTVTAGPVFGDRVRIDSRETVDYRRFNNVALRSNFGTDVYNVYPTELTGFSGNFTVNGDLGAPVDEVLNLFGTAAADTVTAAAATVTVNGKTITAGANIAVLGVHGLGGDDNINLTGFVAALRGEIHAGDGNDTVRGTNLNDIIYGGAGNDILIGGIGSDTQYGEDGNDIFGNATLTANGVADDPGVDFNHGGAGFDNFVWEPGDDADFNNGGDDGADIFRFFGDGGANSFILQSGGTPTHFNALFGATTIDNHGIEDVVVDGQGGADTFILNDLYATEVVNVALNLGAADAAALDAVTVNARNVADNLVVTTSGAGAASVQGLRYNISLSNAESTDSLAINGNNGDDSILVGAGVNAVVPVTINGNDGNDTLKGARFANGGLGDDVLRSNGAISTLDGGLGNDTYVAEIGVDTVIDAGGNDVILVEGTSGNDAIAISLVGLDLVITKNGPATTYPGILGTGIDRIVVNGLNGNDTLTVNSTNGAIPLPIEFDGGSGNDALNLIGGLATSNTYTPGPNPGQGTSTITIAGVPQLVTFQNIEPVLDLVGGPLVVNGTPANNAIDYRVGGVLTNGLVSVDNFETIEFSNKTTLTINALAGSDTISINNPNTPSGLTSVTVTGGDPTETDQLLLNGVAATVAIAVDTGTITGATGTAGAVPILYNTIEKLHVVAGAATNLTVSNSDPILPLNYIYTPGVAADEGEINADSLPISFDGFGAGSTLNFVGDAGGGSDTLLVNGTVQDDFFFVAATTGNITLNDRATITQTALEDLLLSGLEGDDVFNVAGPQPWFTITLSGGSPGASDVANFTGDGSPMFASFTGPGSALVFGGGMFVSTAGVETLNVDAATASLFVTGTIEDDDATIRVASATSGQVQLGVSLEKIGDPAQQVISPVLNYTNITGPLQVDLGLGDDTLAVVGNPLSQTFNVNPSGAPVAFPLPYGIVPANTIQVDDGNDNVLDGTILFAGIEGLQIAGLEGNDTFNVTPGPIPVFVDGGDPIGTTAGDRIVVVANGNPVLFEPGPERDEGGFVFGGVNERVSFDHIEAITVDTPDCVIITGTNADDDITIIARDASTHAGADGTRDFTAVVNDGIEILYLNVGGVDLGPGITVVGNLFIDGLAGDDDIVLRTPAPNGAPWSMNVRVAGGPPASPTGDQGDVLELETPGSDSVFFTPTGPESGVILVDENGNATFEAGDTQILIGQFFDACPPLNYDSSPGGIETIVYDGVDGTDELTFNGTFTDDTTVFNAGIGTGTFRSAQSPDFDFSIVANIEVNGGVGGFDVVQINGTEGADTVISSPDAVLLFTQTTVRTTTFGTNVDRMVLNTFGSGDIVALSLAVPGLEKIIDVGAGNDFVDLRPVAIDPADPTIFGGDGDDTIIGSPNADVIFGGRGNDILIGFDGNDVIYGEEGNDLFGSLTITPDGPSDRGSDIFYGGDGSDRLVWEPGDGSDIFEGGGGEGDELLFFGSNGGNRVEVFGGGNNFVNPTFGLLPGEASRAIVALNPTAFLTATVFIDTADVESIHLELLDGIDETIVNNQVNNASIGGGFIHNGTDLSHTHVRSVEINLGLNDGVADQVEVHGKLTADNILVRSLGDGFGLGPIEVAGFAYSVNIDESVSGDLLIVRGQSGDDTIKAEAGTEDRIDIRLDGDEGDDSLSADAILNGGAGNDFLEGGAGDDTLNGGDGEDTMIGRGGVDVYDGGAGFDTILVRGTSDNDTIQVDQLNAGTLTHTIVPQIAGVPIDGGTQTENFTNVEEVRIEALAGDDIIRASISDALFATPNASLRFTVIGGPSQTRDRLAVIDDGADDLTIYRKGQDNSSGSFTIGPANPEPFDIVFEGVEYSEVLDQLNRPITQANNNGRIVVFKHDPFEANNDILVATHLGADYAINIDPTIDPGSVSAGPPFNFTLPGDEDWYRVEAMASGTLDFQVFFQQIETVASSGRPGLPGNGNLDIFVFDSDGTLIAGIGPTFGGNDNGGLNPELDVAPNLANERIRIPAVQGQVYYLRVVGAPVIQGLGAINNYNITIINSAPAVPYDIELDDNLGFGDAFAGGTPLVFSATSRPGTSGLSPINGYYVGKEITFTTGLRAGESAIVTAYTFLAGVGTFTVTPGFSGAPAAGDDLQVDAVDTGRSQLDDVTRDNTPTIFFRLDDGFFLNDLPGNPVTDTPPDEIIPIPFQGGPAQPLLAGYAIAIFDEGPGTVGATPPQTPLGFATNAGDLNNNGVIDGLEVFVPGVYKFTTPVLADGSHFLTARVQMIDPALPQQTGFGPRSLSLEIVVDTVVPPVSFGDPVDPNDGLAPDSDSGVSPPNPDTLIDLITNDVTPTFWGRGEADAIVRLYADNLNVAAFPGTIPGVFDPFDIFIGQDTAIPLDGANQEPHGYWEINSIVSFNDPTYFPLDGLRTVFVTAEDPAGNINPAIGEIELQVFIDTQGPQVTNIQIVDPVTGVSPYDLFNPKGVDANLQGPTPLVTQLKISFQDLPARVLPFLYRALKDETVVVDHFQLFGDQNGRIAIQSVMLMQADPPPAGLPATAMVTLKFFTPLPDDRYTLVITDSILDIAGNPLDGETNAAEPVENPTFPSGDGVPGGDFVARFTVDSRPELGVYAGLRAYIDINGNFVYDPEGQDNDHVNRDIVFRFGSTSDALFAGKFVTPPGVNVQQPAPIVPGRFFDQFAAYGNVLGSFRWLFDFDSNGVADLVTTQPAGLQINGVPVAGNFDNNIANGDEIGLFDGTRWYFDTNHNFIIDAADFSVATAISGFPQVGDIDGDGREDLVTFQNDTFFVDFFANGYGNLDATIPLTLDGGGLGFPGVSERAIVADMNQDGIDDFGVWVPGNLGQTASEISEWYFLVSETVPGGPTATHLPGAPVAGNVPGSLWAFQNFPIVGGAARRHFEPVPFGTSLFAIFGDEPAFPLVGNFDPPPSGVNPETQTTIPANNNFVVAASDAGTEPRVVVIDRATGQPRLDFLAYNAAFTGGVRVATGDVDGDGMLDIITAPGAGGGPHIRVFSGADGTLLKEFFAYAPAFAGGVFVASADFNGDNKADIVTAADAGGGPHVKVFDGVSGALLREFFAYAPAFTGGVRVATGDVNGDHTPDIVTGAGPGGGPHVRVFSGADGAELKSFFAYSPAFTGGVYVAAGDLNGDQRADIVTGAGPGGGPHVSAFDAQTHALLHNFFAYDPAFTGGVRVAAGDFDRDGKDDIHTAAGPGGGPHVRVISGDDGAVLGNFMAELSSGIGLFVAGGTPGVGSPLVAAAGGGAGSAAIGQAQLDLIVAAALSDWEAAGANTQVLRRAKIRLADLPGATLGMAYADEVLIDRDAAGHGWDADGDATVDAGKIDLLSVVEHELGHLLGLDDLDADAHDLMAAELSTGLRRTLSEVDAAFGQW
jgi:hypothetical protein